MALHVCGDLGVAVVKLTLQEFDDALDARACRGVGDAHALTLSGQHLHELAPAQHQGLQPLQLGVGQRLDEALALGVLVQHAGKGRQHPGVQRVGLGQRTHKHVRSRAPCAG